MAKKGTNGDELGRTGGSDAPAKPRSAKCTAFLAAYATCATVARAAEIAKVHANSHSYWMHHDHDETYAKDFAAAHELGCEAVSAEVHRRGVEGFKKGIYYKGKRTAWELQYSDRMLELRAKALMPDTYKERREIEHSGAVSVELHAEIMAAVVEIKADPNYVEYCRNLALEQDEGAFIAGHAGTNGEPRQVAVERPSGADRQGHNGHDRGA